MLQLTLKGDELPVLFLGGGWGQIKISTEETTDLFPGR